MVLEPDNFSRDVPLLVSAVLRACSQQRRALTQRAILDNDLAGLKSILAYHTLAEAVLQDSQFSVHGTPLHFLVQHPASLPCLPLLLDRGALTSSPNAQGLLPVHSAVQAGLLPVVQRLVDVAAWPPEQGGAGMPAEVLVNLRTTPPCLSGEGVEAGGKDPATPSSAEQQQHPVDRTPLHLSTDEEVSNGYQ